MGKVGRFMSKTWTAPSPPHEGEPAGTSGDWVRVYYELVSDWILSSCQKHGITSGQSNAILNQCTFDMSCHLSVSPSALIINVAPALYCVYSLEEEWAWHLLKDTKGSKERLLFIYFFNQSNMRTLGCSPFSSKQCMQIVTQIFFFLGGEGGDEKVLKKVKLSISCEETDLRWRSDDGESLNSPKMAMGYLSNGLYFHKTVWVSLFFFNLLIPVNTIVTVSCACGELRTQKLKSHLVRTQSLNILPLKPWVGQYMAIHATLTARDFLLAYFYPSGPFTCIFSKTAPDFSCVDLWFDDLWNEVC